MYVYTQPHQTCKRERVAILRVATSVGRVLFALPLLAASGVSAWRPVWIELHVQLPFAPRQLIVLGLFLAAQRMPLNRRELSKFAPTGRHQEKPHNGYDLPPPAPTTHSAQDTRPSERKRERASGARYARDVGRRVLNYTRACASHAPAGDSEQDEC